MDKKPINILSLFDGMGCGRIALERLGYPVNMYYASEIDKSAIKTTSTKWDGIIHLGSVTEVKAAGLEKIDILMAGSPCQGFSFAGKQLAFDDPRSVLFFEFVRILEECRKINPNVIYLLENVRMKKEHEDVISRILGIQPLNINSELVSAQCRERLYWTNIHMGTKGLFGDNYCMIPQPKDKKIFLRDILQPVSEIDEKYYLSERALARIQRKEYSQPKINLDKTGTLNTKNNSGQLSVDSGTTLVMQGVLNQNGVLREVDDYLIINKQGGLKPNQHKSGCFTAGGNSGGNHSDMDLIAVREEAVCVAMRGRNPENPKSRQAGLPTEQHLEFKSDGKTNCLTSVQKDNLVYIKQVLQVNPSTESGGNQPFQQNRVYSPDGLFPALTAEIAGRNNILDDGIRVTDNYIQWEGSGFDQDNRAYFEDGKSGTLDTKQSRQKVLLRDFRIRRLTPIEVCRLQTVYDDVKLLTFEICQDTARSYVSAVERNHKKPPFAENAMTLKHPELNGSVRNVIGSILQKSQQIEPIALQIADTQTPRLTEQCTNTNLRESNITANNVVNHVMFNCLDIEGDFAEVNVFINTIQGSITICGKAESRKRLLHSILQSNGETSLEKFGSVINQHAKDAEINTARRSQDFTRITSSQLSLNYIELIANILYFFAQNVTDLCTQKGTQKVNLFVKFHLVSNYFFDEKGEQIVSDTQIYKMCGNGWTVDVIAHILSFMGK